MKSDISFIDVVRMTRSSIFFTVILVEYSDWYSVSFFRNSAQQINNYNGPFSSNLD